MRCEERDGRDERNEKKVSGESRASERIKTDVTKRIWAGYKGSAHTRCYSSKTSEND